MLWMTSTQKILKNIWRDFEIRLESYIFMYRFRNHFSWNYIMYSSSYDDRLAFLSYSSHPFCSLRNLFLWFYFLFRFSIDGDFIICYWSPSSYIWVKFKRYSNDLLLFMVLLILYRFMLNVNYVSFLLNIQSL